MTEPPQVSDGDSAAVDVIVATRNREDDVARMLDSLRAQTMPHFRVAIVDQSDDVSRTRDLVADLEDSRFEHITDHARGKSRALNLGLRRTRASLVAFTDDDCVVDIFWLQELVSAAEMNPSAGVVFGNVVPGEHDPELQYIPGIKLRERVFDSVPNCTPWLLGMGASMLVRRAALSQVGGFDVDLGPGGTLRTGEEAELAFRMLRNGFAVVQHPAAEVVHHGARAIGDGTARRLITDASFAIAAGLGKHARARDRVAFRVFAQQLGDALRGMAIAMARRQPPFELRRTARLLEGFVAGLRAGPSVPAL